jgi:hypothetical protein
MKLLRIFNVDFDVTDATTDEVICVGSIVEQYISYSLILRRPVIQ